MSPMLARKQNLFIILILPLFLFPARGVSASKNSFETAIEQIESENYQEAYKTLIKLKGKEEAIENIKEAIQGYIAALKEDNLVIPEDRLDALLVAV